MASVLTKEESKELLALCRTGRLYEIEQWIRGGKSLQIAEGIRGTPLQIVVEKGFQSLVELLVRNETQVRVKNKALNWAVEHRRADLVKLLVTYGAEISSVSFAEVLRTWDGKIIRFFLDQGANVIADRPFAQALGDRVQSTLKIFKECQELRPELATELKQQAERALRFFSSVGNLKWVNLMLWLGADPRAKGPTLYSRSEDDPECDATAIEEACLAGKLDVLRRFKLSPETDDLAEFLRWATVSAHADVIHYLLDLGARPNDCENGGSSALDRCLWHLEYEDGEHIRFGRPISRWRVHHTLEAIAVLVKAGAVWQPDDARSSRHFSRTLLKAEPALVIDIFELLKKHGACTIDTIRKFLDTPPMRRHLAGQEWHLRRLGVTCSDTHLVPTVANRLTGRVPAQPPLRIPHRLLARFNREKLYQEVWSQPMWKLAPDYGVSDVALAKTCRKLMIPAPGRGYWAKVASGKRVKNRSPLPTFPTPG